MQRWKNVIKILQSCFTAKFYFVSLMMKINYRNLDENYDAGGSLLIKKLHYRNYVKYKKNIAIFHKIAVTQSFAKITQRFAKLVFIKDWNIKNSCFDALE